MSQSGPQRPQKYVNQTILDHAKNGHNIVTSTDRESVLTPVKTIHKNRENIKKILISLSTALVTVLLIGAFSLMHHKRAQPLPAVITNSRAFNMYYFKSNQPPNGLRLRPGSASLTNGTLVYSLVDDKNEVIGITEQKLPEEFTNSVLQGTEVVQTSHGKATISNIAGGRTTGSLTTTDGTLILVNTDDPISADTIKEVLRSLSPIQ